MKTSWPMRFMASLLTVLLFVVAVTLAANQTFLSDPYMKSELQKQHAYARLSAAISQDASSQAGSAADSQLKSQLQQVITPAVLQQRVDKTIDQIRNYYQHNGPVPTLDVSDLINNAQAQGVPIPNSPTLQKPIRLSGLSKTKQLADVLPFVGIGLGVVILALVLTLLILARKNHNYRPLAAVLISLGVMMSVTGGALLLVPRIFNHLYTFNPVTNPYGTLIHDISLDVVHDFALHLLIPGAAILVAGILLRILVGKVHKRKSNPPREDEATPTSPAPTSPAPITSAPTDAPEDVPMATPPMPRPPRPPRKIQG